MPNNCIKRLEVADTDHKNLPITSYQFLSIAIIIMSIRVLCKQSRRPSYALFYFREEEKTGIAPTRIIIEKQLDLTVGMLVNVNWDGEKVEAELLALDGES